MIHTPTNVWFYLYEISEIGKFIAIESKMVVRAWQEGGNGELFLNGYRISLWDDEKVLKICSDNVCTTLWYN